jgi:hypothetical protein
MYVLSDTVQTWEFKQQNVKRVALVMLMPDVEANDRCLSDCGEEEDTDSGVCINNETVGQEMEREAKGGSRRAAKQFLQGR